MSSRGGERHIVTPQAKQVQAATASYTSHWGNEKDLRFRINNNKQISCATKYLDLTQNLHFIVYIEYLSISPVDGKESVHRSDFS